MEYIMAKFKVTVRKYRDEMLEIEAQDKISATMTALSRISDPELKCTVLSIEPSNDPKFEINSSVKVNGQDLTGVVMKRKFSDMDNEHVYKILCEDSTFQTFFEHELIEVKNGTVHH